MANIDTQHVQLDLGATTVTTIDGVTNTASTTYVNKDMVEQFKEINKRLLRVRAHIAATAKESGMDTVDLI